MNDYFHTIYADLKQDAPGSNEETLAAFNKLDLPDHPEIIDIGCGKGRHTIEIAKHTNGRITAVDNYKPSLDILKNNAEKNNVSASIKCLKADMCDLNVPPASFDLVWSEGAIYNMGFSKGIREWKNLVKACGYLVVSELVWIRNDPPGELRAFWEEEYPDMLSLTDAVAIIERKNLDLLEHFQISREAWDNYYIPLEQKLEEERIEQNGNVVAQEVITMLQQEIDVYRNFKDFFGYVFFIMRKTK